MFDMDKRLWKSIDNLWIKKKSFPLVLAWTALFLCLNCGDNKWNKNIDVLGDLYSEETIWFDNLYKLEENTNNFLFDDFDQEIVYIAEYIWNWQYDAAIEKLLGQESLLLSQKSDIDQNKLRDVYSLFWQCYLANKKFDLAMDYYNKAYDIALDLNDIKRQLLNLNDLSVLFFQPEDIEKKFEILKQAALLIENNPNVLEDVNLIYPAYFVYTNLSNYYVDSKQYSLWKPYLFKAKKIMEEYSSVFSKREEIIFISCEADYLIEENRFADAINIYKKWLKVAEEINHLEYQTWLLNAVKKVYVSMWNYEKAYSYQTKEHHVASTLFNRESEDRISELQTIYETDRLKSENKEKEAELEIQKAQLWEQKQKNRLAWLATATALFSTLWAGMFISALRRKNKIIEGQRDEYLKLNEEIQKANDSINSSINYASRIQESVLQTDISKFFPQSFVYSKPKGIIGWDFYFSSEGLNGKKILILADCTGHWVPGSLLTMLGKSNIQQIYDKAESPDEIIDYMDKHFLDLHKKSTSDTNSLDAMDIVCIFYDPETKIMDFSSALMNIFIIRANWNVESVRATSRAEVWSKTKPPSFDWYVSKKIELFSWDEVLLYSDWMSDQFDKDEKKLGIARFRKMLPHLSTIPMVDRASYLQKYYETLMRKDDWKIVSQTDDMTMVGFKVE